MHAFIELLMLQRDRHPLFATALKKTRNLSRKISTYKTPIRIINISAYSVGSRGPFIVISWKVFSQSKNYWLSRTIKLRLISGDIEVTKDMHTSRRGCWMLTSTYTSKNLDNVPLIKKKFDRINLNLNHQKTVRVNPYDLKEILRSEETEIDLKIKRMFEEVKRWARALDRAVEASGGKPGIITPRDDAELN